MVAGFIFFFYIIIDAFFIGFGIEVEYFDFGLFVVEVDTVDLSLADKVFVNRVLQFFLEPGSQDKGIVGLAQSGEILALVYFFFDHRKKHLLEHPG